MNISKLVVSAILVSTLASCSQGLKTKKSLETEIDSVSYAVGMNIGQQMRSNAKEIDQDLFTQGYLNGRDSSSLLLETKDLKKIINDFFRKKQQAQMEKMKVEQDKKASEKYGEFKMQNEQFLVDNKTKENVKTTATGLQYIVLKEGTGKSPAATDKVKVHYHGTTIDGTVFDSSVERGAPIEFALNQVIKGWTEGVQLMKEGGKYKFFVPQALAYGNQEKGKVIKPFSTLIFEVELFEVK